MSDTPPRRDLAANAVPAPQMLVPTHPPSTARSAATILGCFLAGGCVAQAADTLIEHAWPTAVNRAGLEQATGFLLVMLAVNIAINIGAGYAAAALAPNRPRAHAATVGLLRAGLIILFPLLQMGGQDAAAPWYHLADLLAAVPAATLGATLLAQGTSLGRVRTAKGLM